eukprot:g6250.t1
MSRDRSKPCFLCSTPSPTLYRFQYDESGEWRFGCLECWNRISQDNPLYRYGDYSHFLLDKVLHYTTLHPTYTSSVTVSQHTQTQATVYKTSAQSDKGSNETRQLP